jgi:hypothetical protein
MSYSYGLKSLFHMKEMYCLDGKGGRYEGGVKKSDGVPCR